MDECLLGNNLSRLVKHDMTNANNFLPPVRHQKIFGVIFKNQTCKFISNYSVVEEFLK